MTHLLPAQAARVLSDPKVSDETRRLVLGSYDGFLLATSDPEKRAKLKAVSFDAAADDPTYQELRRLSHEFRRGIRRLFFEEHPTLKRLIRDFGVF